MSFLFCSEVVSFSFTQVLELNPNLFNQDLYFYFGSFPHFWFLPCWSWRWDSLLEAGRFCSPPVNETWHCFGIHLQTEIGVGRKTNKVLRTEEAKDEAFEVSLTDFWWYLAVSRSKSQASEELSSSEDSVSSSLEVSVDGKAAGASVSGAPAARSTRKASNPTARICTSRWKYEKSMNECQKRNQKKQETFTTASHWLTRFGGHCCVARLRFLLCWPPDFVELVFSSHLPAIIYSTDCRDFLIRLQLSHLYNWYCVFLLWSLPKSYVYPVIFWPHLFHWCTEASIGIYRILVRDSFLFCFRWCF